MPLSERQMTRASLQTWSADQATDNKTELAAKQYAEQIGSLKKK